MKHTQKLFALLLALVMVFSFSAAALAYDPPTSSTDVAAPAWISSVTVDNTTAYYQRDDNTGASVYVRALLPRATKTEYDLQTATVVVITTGSNVPVLKDGATVIPYDSAAGNVYTWNSLDLVNKAYSLSPSAGRASYLAAGLETGQVGISAGDPLKTGSVTMDGIAVSVYGSNVQNPFMGNLDFIEEGEPWTFINYFISGILPDTSDLSDVDGTFNLAAGATLSGGNATPIIGGYNFDFVNYKAAIKISNSGEERVYYVMLAVDGQGIVIQQYPDGSRNYDINFDELKGSTYYTGLVKTKSDAIDTAWDVYISTPRTFPAGTKVMGVLQNFITWAETTVDPNTSDEYFTYSSNTGGGSYLSVLNGLSYADCGSLAGWMYTDDPLGYFWTSPSDHSRIPGVGAGDYVLATNSKIVWFYTVDYFNWF